MIDHCAICYETLKPGERVICKECGELENKVEAEITKRSPAKGAKRVG